VTILQEEFDEMIRRTYPDPPKEGSRQYEDLRDAFFGGALIASVHGEDLVKPELEAFGRAKRMNIKFGGDWT
jgi:hypothetical protein